MFLKTLYTWLMSPPPLAQLEARVSMLEQKIHELETPIAISDRVGYLEGTVMATPTMFQTYMMVCNPKQSGEAGS